jgi:hypothetical protein
MSTNDNPRRFRARDLRIVSNRTREYDGGYSVETADGTVQAGPYACREDAAQAKRDLVATGYAIGAR